MPARRAGGRRHHGAGIRNPSQELPNASSRTVRRKTVASCPLPKLFREIGGRFLVILAGSAYRIHDASVGTSCATGTE